MIEVFLSLPLTFKMTERENIAMYIFMWI
jgi:hypothetical protein